MTGYRLIAHLSDETAADFTAYRERRNLTISAAANVLIRQALDAESQPWELLRGLEFTDKPEASEAYKRFQQWVAEYYSRKGDNE